MSDHLHDILHQTFRIPHFRPQQESVIRTIIDGHSALAIFPTGSGKSLLFQVPALALNGLTLVISPLIALMSDQVSKLQALGIPAHRIDSSIPDDEIDEILNQAQSNQLKLLYLSPERLASHTFLKKLKTTRIALIAIDEAHCISEWGHNFRPDYLKIAQIAKKLRPTAILALTATATPKVIQEIRKAFRIQPAHVYNAGVIRTNLHLQVIPTPEDDKFEALCQLLRQSSGATIIYATTRKTTESLTAHLQRAGFSAICYHAGLDPDSRAKAQAGFMSDSFRIVVATIAFGMGIDKPNIRSVIHYNLPKSLEGYSQEIGRAGRDGQASHCTLLADPSDTRTLENFIHGSTPSPEALKNLLDRILRSASPKHCFALSTYEYSITHDLREETVRTILAYLELLDIIQYRGCFHDYYRIRLVRTIPQLMAGRSRSEIRALQTLLDAGESRYGSLHFKLQALEDSHGISRQTAASLLTALHEAGDAKLEQRSVRSIYRVSPTWNHLPQPVIQSLTHRFLSRADFEHSRIHSVLQWIQSPLCRSQALAHYFGHRQHPRCGNCDICNGSPPTRLQPLPSPPITPEEWQSMRQLRDEKIPELLSHTQLARFLCGISSPATYRNRLQSRPEFGMWQHLPFTDVLTYVSA